MNVKGYISRTSLQVKKYSPEILTVVGVVSFIGTVFVACKQTLKADDILDNHRREMDKIEEAKEVAKDDEYTENDAAKDKLNVIAHTAVGFAKLYAPAAGLGVISLTSFLAANRILKARYLGAVAAFNLVSEAFDKYRSKVIEEGGVDLDRHYMYGAERSKIDIVECDENGKTKKHKEVIETIESVNNKSPYSRFFDSSCADWDKNPEFNMMFLKAQEAIAQRMLEERGHLFLNEVYDLLGFERTGVGAVVGWVYGMGDNFVDFGLYDQDNEATRRFVNGLENVILLDFNVDGVIYDKI